MMEKKIYHSGEVVVYNDESSKYPKLSNDLVKKSKNIINDILEELSTNKSIIDEMEQEGKRIYSNNPNYKDIATFMEHPLSREFFETHMKSWGETSITILNLKLYSVIDEFIKKNNLLDKNTNALHRICIMSKLMNNPDIRSHICKEMSAWINTTANTLKNTQITES